jgi:hypothetical protein
LRVDHGDAIALAMSMTGEWRRAGIVLGDTSRP